MPKLTEEEADGLVAIWSEGETGVTIIEWMEFTEDQYKHWVKTDETPFMDRKAYERAISKLEEHRETTERS